MAQNSVRLALSAMAVALATVVMFLTGALPLGTLALPALAGVFLIAVVMECGAGWAWAAYLSVSALSLLIAADREAVLFFILLFGCYPILKAGFEAKFRKAVRIPLKFLFFNAASILEFLLAVKLLGAPPESLTLFGHFVPWLFLAVGNVVFAVYDCALSLLAISYWKKIHPLVARWTRRP